MHALAPLRPSGGRAALACALPLAVWSTLAWAQVAAPQVTLPLERYEELRQVQERTALTVVDTLRVAGSFQGRDLTVEFSGRASGRLPPVTVLGPAEGLALYGCEGEALLSRAEAGGFQLTPLAPRFRLRCRLVARGSDRLELSITPAVLWIEAAVTDGEYVAGSDVGGQRSFAVVRQAAASGERLEPTATGRYLLTLLPDETRFRYQIEVRNPNRGRQKFELRLAAQEHVQEVDAPAAYEAQAGRYTFDLPPGDTTLTLSGSLPGTRFAAPTQASLQYVLIESHPLLRAAVSGDARRISPNEVGLTASFRGAQAFLLGGDSQALQWQVTRLEALHTTSYAVRSMRHVLFLAADGLALGESAFELDNQGAADVHLPSGAEPTYASLGGEATLLTKDADGALWLPLAQGEQPLLVQHRQAFRRRLGLAWATLQVPQLAVPATQAQLELRYPPEWQPLFESYASTSRVWQPSGAQALVFLFLGGWVLALLPAFGVPPGPARPLALLSALAALAWEPAAGLLLVAAGGATLLLLLARLRGVRWSWGRLLLGAAAAAAVGLGLLAVVAFVAGTRRPRSYDYENAQMPSRTPAAPAPKAASELLARQNLQLNLGQQYQGLPAKFDLPEGAHRTHFHRQMLGGSGPRRVRLLLVSEALLEALRALCVLGAAFLAWRRRAALSAGWNARWAALRSVPAASSAAQGPPA